MYGLDGLGKRNESNRPESALASEHIRSTLQGQIESEIPEAFADNKNIKIKVTKSSINIAGTGKQSAQIIFEKGKVLVKSKGPLPEQRFEYKDKNGIITALKNIF